MLNKTTLIGHLGKDPEIKSTTNGEFAVFNVATGEKWKDKATGEQKEKTEWHRIVVFNKHIVEVIKKYVHKGSRVYIEGQNQTRKWTDDKGIERMMTEIVLSHKGVFINLDKKESNPNTPPDDVYGENQ